MDIVSSSYTNATCQVEPLEHTQPEQLPYYLILQNNNYVNSNIFDFPLQNFPETYWADYLLETLSKELNQKRELHNFKIAFFSLL